MGNVSGLGILCALCTSVSWACANVTIQRCGQVLGTTRAMLWALLVGGLAAAVVALPIEGAAWELAPRVLQIYGLCVGFGLVANAGMFFAFAHGRLSVVVPLVSSWSVISAAVAVGIFGERVTRMQFVSAAIVFLGGMLVTSGATRSARAVDAAARDSGGAFPGAARRTAHLAIVSALVAAVGYGALMPTLSLLGPALGEVWATSFLCLGYVVAGLPIALLLRQRLAPPESGVLWLVLCAGLSEAAGIACLVLARRYAPMTVVGPLSSLAATFTVLYAWLVLRERPARIVIVGGALCCLGVVLLSLG